MSQFVLSWQAVRVYPYTYPSDVFLNIKKKSNFDINDDDN